MIALGSDHAGLPLKKEIIALLEEMNIPYHDYGTYTSDSCDYAMFAQRAAKAVVSGECERGILCCGTGIGISIAANKVKGIRCCACSDCYSAKMCRVHNDANMLALGARVVGTELGRRNSRADAISGALTRLPRLRTGKIWAEPHCFPRFIRISQGDFVSADLTRELSERLWKPFGASPFGSLRLRI